ncbi:sarcosine oxidase subunit gamma [Acidocella aquatica]|uniref:Sarcosine oxidase subunit gamma n=1 Tax=Acidocella aquatica TaxID=1922313 RepID=A0ABQ6A7A3_9PROT|nr:sarcosine oxidase subunit gamma family protein [Acidocella aquatica]GLR68320.1 sarcosine oxidase subunit gamma [Acidocella aquatica]
MANLVHMVAPARRVPPCADTGDRRYTPVNGGARFLLRLREAAIGPAAEALGIDLAVPLNRASVVNSRGAMRLSPDEWLLLWPETEAASVAPLLAARLTDRRYSLTDISHRQTGLMLNGAAVPDILNSGCALDFDLAAFPVGMVTRTNFFKAEAVLWRQDEFSFYLEVWRSFVPYVWSLLSIVGREYPE